MSQSTSHYRARAIASARLNGGFVRDEAPSSNTIDVKTHNSDPSQHQQQPIQRVRFAKQRPACYDLRRAIYMRQQREDRDQLVAPMKKAERCTCTVI